MKVPTYLLNVRYLNGSMRPIIREIKVLPSSRKITKIIFNIVIQYKNPKFDVGGILSLELRFSV